MILKIAVLLASLVSQAGVLDVPRVKQETPMWCWLASSEMVNKFHGVLSVDKDPDMQCSIVHYMAQAGMMPTECFFDCTQCPYPAFTSENLRIPLDKYSAAAALNGGNSVTSELLRSAAELSKVKEEIDAKRPILVGINPTLRGITASEPEHLAVIIGYEGETIRVNDPYDYFDKDPYLSVGATKISDGVYDISYTELVKSFAWQTTVFVTISK